MFILVLISALSLIHIWGNIECMRKLLMWRGIYAEVVTYTCEDSGFDLSDVDIVFIGGGSDREQKIVCHRLLAVSYTHLDVYKRQHKKVA